MCHHQDNVSTLRTKLLIARTFIFKSRLKMNVLATNKQVLAWILLYIDKQIVGKRWQMGSICMGVTVFTLNVCVVLYSVPFFLQYISTNLEDALYCFSQFVIFVCSTYMFIIAFMLRHRITAIIDGLTQIYEQCKWLFEWILCSNAKFRWK